MGQVVLKNSAGKILRNSSGRLLKQNYNPGKSLIEQSSLALLHRIRIYDIVINPYSDDASIILNEFRVTTNNAGAHWHLKSANYGAIFADIISNQDLYYYKLNAADEYLTGGLTQYWNPANINRINDLKWVLVNYEFSMGSINVFANAETTPSALLDLIGSGIANEPSHTLELLDGPKNFGNILKYDMNYVIVYDRKLTQTEVEHLYNNNLKNDPLSTLGMLCFVKFNLAEALDFSAAQDGSDMRPGFRDVSGNNRHAEYVNPPAGTIQEQVDYINTNYLGAV